LWSTWRARPAASVSSVSSASSVPRCRSRHCPRPALPANPSSRRCCLSTSTCTRPRARPGSGPTACGDANMSTDAQLLDQIYADPSADAPRLIYADVLQMRGDPLGEFIAMQILRPDPAHEAALLAAHGRAWLGPLANIVELGPTSQTAFERGFLAIA